MGRQDSPRFPKIPPRFPFRTSTRSRLEALGSRPPLFFVCVFAPPPAPSRSPDPPLSKRSKTLGLATRRYIGTHWGVTGSRRRVRGTLVAVKGVGMVIASLGAIQARFRGLVGVRMSLPRSHLGRVLGLVSGRYARVWRVLHCRLISHRVGAGDEGWTSLGQAIRYSKECAKHKPLANSPPNRSGYKVPTTVPSLCQLCVHHVVSPSRVGASLPVCLGSCSLGRVP